MAVINIEYYSEVLGMNRKVNVIYPESSKVEDFTQTDIPVLYLLHGMSGSYSEYNRIGALYVAQNAVDDYNRNPVIMVMLMDMRVQLMLSTKNLHHPLDYSLLRGSYIQVQAQVRQMQTQVIKAMRQPPVTTLISKVMMRVEYQHSHHQGLVRVVILSPLLILLLQAVEHSTLGQTLIVMVFLTQMNTIL